MSLPEGWVQKESKSHQGKLYYYNTVTKETQWTLPTSPAIAGGVDQQVQALHILKKHRGSRRPASWRNDNITQSKEDAIRQISDIRAQLLQILSSEGYDAMRAQFERVAYAESDCGSHERGGDLGVFGRGQMQKSFEDASFALKVGELSDLVDSDSGIHIILRVK